MLTGRDKAQRDAGEQKLEKKKQKKEKQEPTQRDRKAEKEKKEEQDPPPSPKPKPPPYAHPEGLEPVDIQEELLDEVTQKDGTRIITKKFTITYPDGKVCRRTTTESIRMKQVEEKDAGKDVTWKLQRRGVCCCCIPWHWLTRWFPCFNKKKNDNGGNEAPVEEINIEENIDTEVCGKSGEGGKAAAD